MEINEITKVKDAILDDESILLPVGYMDEDGNIHRKISMDYLIGEVEERMADRKVRENGGKVITELLFGIVTAVDGIPKVTKDVIRNLKIADRDFLTLMSRIKNIGEEISWDQKCPHCGSKIRVIVNGLELPLSCMDDHQAKEVTFELPIGIEYQGERRKNITIMMPNGVVQERVATITENPITAINAMLTLITKKIEGIPHVNPDLFKKMTKKDRDFISQKLDEFKAGVDMITTEHCSECGEEFQAIVPLRNLLGE